MDIQNSLKDKHSSLINELIKDLRKGLENTREIKTTLVLIQKFDPAVGIRSAENHLEKSIKELEKIVQKHYT
ncbi:hypothetical protein [Wenyingzhuangia aestuarii]|uniref:hypothetical protein n=1 Tax=Wenyingzhuangia aestuarii TaxID=1647582 RepID=UPI001439F43C|nr:hypothetical protein [Wenyingzhuangia aestuarii]NJB84196.1 hypothetical protein [Wenyingzhuangia aestuarii]